MPKSVLPPDYFNLNDGNPGWRAFKQATLGMRNWCDERDVELRFVIIPSLTCLNERYPYEELRQSVRSFLEESDVPYVDLFPVFADYEPRDL